jgi:aquaporin Z|tara:strand:+ start:93 stop:362 length:270 start_codon:yes stop_codon:yes gene_type:complete
MLNLLIIEFVGTFIFLAVILSTGEALPIAMALATVIYLGGATSGGHFNPAVSTMFFLKGDLDMMKLFGYVVAQVLGGVAALSFNKFLLV